MKIRIILEAETEEEFARAKADAACSIHAFITNLPYLARRQQTTIVPRFAGMPLGNLVDVGKIISALLDEADYTNGLMAAAAKEERYADAAESEAWINSLETMIDMIKDAANETTAG